MKITITTELNDNSHIPQWLIDGVKAADRAGVAFVITTGNSYIVAKPRKKVKP